MSNNTNTLFWIITGAVIIVAVFLLINNSSTNTMTRISDKFSNITAEAGIESDLKIKQHLQEVDPSYIQVKSCGINRIYIEGYRIEVYDLYYQMGAGTYTRWYIINNNKTTINKKVTLYLYECGTNKLIGDLEWSVSGVKPGRKSLITSWHAGEHNNINGYYIKVTLK